MSKAEFSDLAFSRAFAELLAHEGRVAVDEADDPGGLTKFGISRQAYPDIDIRALTEDDAREIYYRDYWRRYRYDEIESVDISAKMLLNCVNIGPGDAGYCLQRAMLAVGVELVQDGIVGSRTIAAVNGCASTFAIFAALRSETAGWYRREAMAKPHVARRLKGLIKRAYS